MKPQRCYKAARDNNKKTGASPTYSLYFEDFHEVLCTHDVVNTTFARKVGVLTKMILKMMEVRTI